MTTKAGPDIERSLDSEFSEMWVPCIALPVMGGRYQDALIKRKRKILKC
jgi:hypothetical protein